MHQQHDAARKYFRTLLAMGMDGNRAHRLMVERDYDDVAPVHCPECLENIVDGQPHAVNCSYSANFFEPPTGGVYF